MDTCFLSEFLSICYSEKKNLRDKFAIFGDYLYFVMGSAEFVFTTVVLIVNNSTLVRLSFKKF